ncbi:hypothetical protein F5Y07DRAFT_372275 [Xylaria sp. FL0933]|nr:hypothetical protein F5Y07DRAFT_372275 [Xylaria sp. FL0933]
MQSHAVRLIIPFICAARPNHVQALYRDSTLDHSYCMQLPNCPALHITLRGHLIPLEAGLDINENEAITTMTQTTHLHHSESKACFHSFTSAPKGIIPEELGIQAVKC